PAQDRVVGDDLLRQRDPRCRGDDPRGALDLRRDHAREPARDGLGIADPRPDLVGRAVDDDLAPDRPHYWRPIDARSSDAVAAASACAWVRSWMSTWISVPAN